MLTEGGDPGNIKGLSASKRYEGALDALVCEWVSVEYLAGYTVSLANDYAANCRPEDVVPVRDHAQRAALSRPPPSSR